MLSGMNNLHPRINASFSPLRGTGSFSSLRNLPCRNIGKLQHAESMKMTLAFKKMTMIVQVITFRFPAGGHQKGSRENEIGRVMRRQNSTVG